MGRLPKIYLSGRIEKRIGDLFRLNLKKVIKENMKSLYAVRLLPIKAGK
jgi:hypothetical protein